MCVCFMYVCVRVCVCVCVCVCVVVGTYGCVRLVCARAFSNTIMQTSYQLRSWLYRVMTHGESVHVPYGSYKGSASTSFAVLAL